ncbi:MAG TPA: DUF58 domain-containing protein [Elusimicrobia bacterium]|nr:DUF58 domain-containing protein [Elusimicrobiota bacterium]HBT60816.1 DUF58 domain-containing protein [Elusimicrobiota bacterium]
MISPEILAHVRRIEIMTGRLVTETLAGEYLSVFKGRGMEFAEVREYVPGDDVRAIDWNVTARTGRPHVRQYAEERELTVAIACDLSGSQFFGSGPRLKKEIAAELSAVLAFSALQNNDKAGLFVFTEGVEEHIPPKKGRRHALHIIREILAFEPRRRGTRIGASLETMVKVLKRRCILFLISDFRDQDFEQSLRLAALKHDVVPIVVSDPRERELPRLNAFVDLEDPESGRRLLVDAAASGLLNRLRREEDERQKKLDEFFARSGLDFIRITTDQPYIDPLIRFFRRRARRLRR